MAEGVDDLIAAVNRVISGEKALRTAALDTHSAHADRIFGKGMAANGSAIGSYSTKPTYVGSKGSPKKLTPKGKGGGGSKFKNGKPRKSRYFGGGYREFRQTIGRKADRVDLRLSGQMERDYKLSADGDGFASGFSNPKNFEKAEGNEDHFKKKIFSLGREEIEDFVKVFEFELGKLLP